MVCYWVLPLIVLFTVVSAVLLGSTGACNCKTPRLAILLDLLATLVYRSRVVTQSSQPKNSVSHDVQFVLPLIVLLIDSSAAFFGGIGSCIHNAPRVQSHSVCWQRSCILSR